MLIGGQMLAFFNYFLSNVSFFLFFVRVNTEVGRNFPEQKSARPSLAQGILGGASSASAQPSHRCTPQVVPKTALGIKSHFRKGKATRQWPTQTPRIGKEVMAVLSTLSEQSHCPPQSHKGAPKAGLGFPPLQSVPVPRSDAPGARAGV